MNKLHDFQSILAPVKEKEFYADYFEKKPLLIQRDDREYFSSLLTINDMAQYLERKDIVYPRIRMVKDGIQLPDELYIKKTAVNTYVSDNIDNEKIFALFDEGASIVCQQLNVSFPILYGFTKRMSDHFKLNVGLNTYLTPASAQAFDPHYDVHDVFILQVHGSKLWKLYDMPVAAAVKRFDKNNWAMQEPSLEVELKQGDTLYIPRGWVHDATTANNNSLHITVGLNVDTWIDVFDLINKETASIENFRKTFNWDNVTVDDFKDTIRELANELIENLDHAKLLAEFKRKKESQVYEVHNGRFKDILSKKDLDDDSVIFLRKQANVNITEEARSITLTVRGSNIKFRLKEKGLIAEILNTDSFTIVQMQNKYPNMAVIKNVQTLIKYGILGIEN